MSLIYFHRFLISCFILFSAYFCWHLIQRYQSLGVTSELWTGIFFGVSALGFAIYLPSVKGRRDKQGGKHRPS